MLMFKEALDFQDIMISPFSGSSVESRRNVDITYPYIGKRKIQHVPISAANMEGVGTFEMARTLSKRRWFTYIHKGYDLKAWYDFIDSMDYTDLNYVVPTIGSSDVNDINYIEKIMAFHKFPRICIDVANGHSISNIQQIGRIRRIFPNTIIIYGNVVNPGVLEVMRYHNCLPDYVKVGIGSGSVCTTRLKTGIGLSQASAIHEFVEWERINDYDVKVISDGGCRTPGDIVKAIALGAEEVMIGGMLSGCDESEVDPTFTNGGYVVSFRGSSHKNSSFYGSDKTYATSEGLDTTVPYKGKADSVCDDIEGGLRSAMSYLAVSTMGEFFSHVEWGFMESQIRTVRRQTDNYS